MWAITIFSLLGTVLNIYKRKECFIIWAVTNATWAVYDWKIGAKEQSLLFVCYFLLAVWGIWKWKS